MDQQGSVAKVTDVNQKIQIAYVYDAFGRQIVAPSGANPAVPNDLVFQSNWITANVGTKQYGISPGGRVYDTETGRFLQRDRVPNVVNLYTAKMIPNGLDPTGYYEVTYTPISPIIIYPPQYFGVPLYTIYPTGIAITPIYFPQFGFGGLPFFGNPPGYFITPTLMPFGGSINPFLPGGGGGGGGGSNPPGNPPVPPALKCDVPCKGKNIGNLTPSSLIPIKENGDILPSFDGSEGVKIVIDYKKNEIADDQGPNDCCCSAFKFIQVVTTNSLWDKRAPAPYVDNYNNGVKVATSSDPWYPPWAQSATPNGQEMHDTPGRNNLQMMMVPPTDLSWMAESCIVCQRNGKPDTILSCVTYGFSRIFWGNDQIGTLWGNAIPIGPKCSGAPSQIFKNTLSNDQDIKYKENINFN
jgi:hypothetical protein